MDNKDFKLRGRTIVCIDWANVYGWFSDLGWDIEPQKLFDYLKSYPEIFENRFYYGTDDNEKSKIFLRRIKSIGFNLITKAVKFVPVSLDKSHFRKIFQEVKEVLENAKEKNSEIVDKLNKLSDKIENLPLPQIDYPEYHTLVTVGEKQLDEIFALIADLNEDLVNANVDINILQAELDKPINRRKCDFDCELVMDVMNNLNNFDCLMLFSGDGDYAALVNNLIGLGKKVILVFCHGHLGKEYKDIRKGLYLCPIKILKNVLK